jgi:hypothetical protein
MYCDEKTRMNALRNRGGIAEFFDEPSTFISKLDGDPFLNGPLLIQFIKQQLLVMLQYEDLENWKDFTIVYLIEQIKANENIFKCFKDIWNCIKNI